MHCGTAFFKHPKPMFYLVLYTIANRVKPGFKRLHLFLKVSVFYFHLVVATWANIKFHGLVWAEKVGMAAPVLFGCQARHDPQRHLQ